NGPHQEVGQRGEARMAERVAQRGVETHLDCEQQSSDERKGVQSSLHREDSDGGAARSAPAKSKQYPFASWIECESHHDTPEDTAAPTGLPRLDDTIEGRGNFAMHVSSSRGDEPFAADA